MAAPTGNQGWAQLRQQARSLESQTEALFHTYSQFSTVSNIPPKPSKEERETEAKLEEILEKVGSFVWASYPQSSIGADANANYLLFKRGTTSSTN